MDGWRFPWPPAAYLLAIAAGLFVVIAVIWLGLPKPAIVSPPPIRHVAKILIPPKAYVAAAKPKILPPKKIAARPSAFDLEQAMNFSKRMARWNPYIQEAAKRFDVPQPWIRAVMQIESGGRTMLVENQPITSSAGAMGLMQLMPSTYRDMRAQYGLGADPYDPHDNIMAGAAYLRFLRSKYPYPAMFEAYNDGPGNLEERLRNGGLLPLETQNYVGHITNTLENGGAGGSGTMVKFTRPNGTPVAINAGAVLSVRAAFPDEYAPGVQSVIQVGRVRQGVRESLASARATIRAHGGV